MHFLRTQRLFRNLCILACFSIAAIASASEYHGQVTFNGLPVPGATIIATQGTKKLVTISNEDGSYAFTDLPDGTWHISIEMQCFAKLDQDVAIVPNVEAGKW